MLIVFDLGRVLIRICDDWRHACEVAGVTWPGGELTPDRRAMVSAAVHRIEVGACDLAGFCADAAPHLNLPPEDIEKIWNAYTRGPFPGAPELLDDLRAAGIPTACLSNTNARHWELLTDPNDPQSQVLSRLDHRFASHLIPARKPDAPAYAHVEESTGHPPESILFFDDLEENITAAESRGWRSFLIPRCENPIPLIRKILVDRGILK